MTEENKPAEDAEQKFTPVCPHCGRDPFTPAAIPFNVPNGVRLLIFMCGDCRKVINAIILEMPQPRVAPAGPRIVMPGRERPQ